MRRITLYLILLILTINIAIAAAPTITSVTTNTGILDNEDNLTITCTGNDAESNQIAYQYRIYKDGEWYTEGAETNITFVDITDPGSNSNDNIQTNGTHATWEDNGDLYIAKYNSTNITTLGNYTTGFTMIAPMVGNQIFWQNHMGTFNGTDFLITDNITSSIYRADTSYNASTILFTDFTGGVGVANYNSTTYTEIDKLDRGGSIWFYDICTDGTYIYVARDAEGIDAYSFNGTDITYITNRDDVRAGAVKGMSEIACYEDKIYTVIAHTGTPPLERQIIIYTFNGTDFIQEHAEQNERVFGVSDMQIIEGNIYISSGGTFTNIIEYEAGEELRYIKNHTYAANMDTISNGGEYLVEAYTIPGAATHTYHKYYANNTATEVKTLDLQYMTGTPVLTASCRAWDGTEYSAWVNATNVTIYGEYYLIINTTDGSNYNWTVEENDILTTTNNANQIIIADLDANEEITVTWNNGLQYYDHNPWSNNLAVIVGEQTPTASCEKTFRVYDAGQGYSEGAKITLEKITGFTTYTVMEAHFTESNGIAVFDTTQDHKYRYTIQKEDYTAVTGNFVANCDPDIIVRSLNEDLDGLGYYINTTCQNITFIDQNYSCTGEFLSYDTITSFNIIQNITYTNGTNAVTTTTVNSQSGIFTYTLDTTMQDYALSIISTAMNRPSETQRLTKRTYTPTNKLSNILNSTIISNHVGMFIIIWLIGAIAISVYVNSKFDGQGILAFAGICILGGLIVKWLLIFATPIIIVKYVLPIWQKINKGETA